MIQAAAIPAKNFFMIPPNKIYMYVVKSYLELTRPSALLRADSLAFRLAACGVAFLVVCKTCFSFCCFIFVDLRRITSKERSNPTYPTFLSGISILPLNFVYLTR